MQELMEEGRIKPDNYQYGQLEALFNPPLPGLTEQMKEWWMNTK